MRIPRIHTPQSLRADTRIELEQGQAHYVARVLRMRAGDALMLFNGTGGQYPATLETVAKNAVVVSTGKFEPVERESPLVLHLGIAVSRGERMDWVVQKATELGVQAITPLLSERTEVRLKGEREEKKLRHWQQVATSACEQCGRNRLPVVNTLQPLQDWCQQAEADLRLVLDPAAGNSDPGAATPASIALLVGPEGGFSAAEIAAARAAGFQSLQLGPRVLRTETAPLAAISLLQARWGDMRAPGN
jgi:16S rRNA (uracil1498-N3)-methyltransferase